MWRLFTFLLCAVPLMGQYVNPGYNPGVTSSQTVNIGLPLNDGGNDSGNANVIEFLPELTAPGSSSTIGSAHVWWGAVASSTWGQGYYSDKTSGCPTGYSHCPNTLLCNITVTSTPSSGFNSQSPAGCGTVAANSIIWHGQITSSNTMQNGRTTNSGIYCGASGVGALQSGVQGSTTFPATAPTVGAYGGCPNMYTTFNCSSACGATLEYYENRIPTGTSTTNVSYTTSILTGDTHPVAVVSVQMDGSVGSHTMSCTLGGNAMTQVIAPIAGGGATLFGSVFILVNPPTGSQSVSCTSSFTGADWWITTYVFSGINQTGTVGNTWRATDTNTDGGSGGSPASVTLSAAHSASGDIVFNWISFDIVSATSNGPAGKTGVLVNFNPASSSVQVGAQITGGTGASLTMTWPFLPTTGTWSTMAFALIPG